MKAKINHQLLNTTTFDSGSLGMMAMVVHQFSTPGLYQIIVKKQRRAITELELSVDKESTEMQLDIDLARVLSNVKAHCEDNRCMRPRIVSPKGYVLFYVSSGSGYSVTVTSIDGKEEFDSTKLTAGDLFSISILEPSRYSMGNMLGHREGEIVVSITPKVEGDIRNLETSYINVSQKGFDPDRIELSSSQGLVFCVSDSARIIVEKKGDETPGKL